MAKKKRPLLFLLFGIVTLIGLGYLLSMYNPKSILPNPIPLSVKPIFLFFGLLFFSLSFLGTYVFNNMRRGVFLGLFICSYLLLRFNHLTDLYFALILLALFVSLEFFFTRYH